MQRSRYLLSSGAAAVPLEAKSQFAAAAELDLSGELDRDFELGRPALQVDELHVRHLLCAALRLPLPHELQLCGRQLLRPS
jgi:hypothetical protein